MCLRVTLQLLHRLFGRPYVIVAVVLHEPKDNVSRQQDLSRVAVSRDSGVDRSEVRQSSVVGKEKERPNTHQRSLSDRAPLSGAAAASCYCIPVRRMDRLESQSLHFTLSQQSHPPLLPCRHSRR